MNNDSNLEPHEHSSAQAPRANVGLILAATIAIGLFPLIFGIYGWRVAGQGDQPLETDRNRWPAPLLETFENSPLTESDLASMEYTPNMDGGVLRLKATPTAVEYVTTTLVPLDEVKGKGTEPPAKMIQRFWGDVPHRWRNHKSSPNDRFYATRQWDLGEEGVFHYLARLNDEDKVVLVWVKYNF